MPELVTIARFSTAVEANLARTRLEAAGIRAWVANELSVLTGMGADDAIELQVVSTDTSRARQELEGRAPEEKVFTWGTEAEPVERCLVCQSSFVEPEQPQILVRIFLAVLSNLLPLPNSLFASKRRVCGVCGYRWREGDGLTTRAPETPTG